MPAINNVMISRWRLYFRRNCWKR